MSDRTQLIEAELDTLYLISQVLNSMQNYKLFWRYSIKDQVCVPG
jgi:hypothetical protein